MAKGGKNGKGAGGGPTRGKEKRVYTRVSYSEDANFLVRLIESVEADGELTREEKAEIVGGLQRAAMILATIVEREKPDGREDD